jgi:putative transposase
MAAHSRKRLLDGLPTTLPHKYRDWLNQKESEESLQEIRNAVNKGTPYGAMNWVEKMVKKFDLLLTTRTRGRPKKAEKGT